MKLFDLRKQRKVSREELAVAMEVTYSTIANFEQGKSIPRVDLARRIAAYLGVPEPDIEWGAKPSADDDAGKDLPAAVA